MEPETGLIRSAHVSGEGELGTLGPGSQQGVPVDRGINGTAIAGRRAIVTGNYITDDRFVHVEDSDAFAERTGLRSVVAAPLFTDDGLLGVIKVTTTRRDAYDDEDAALMEAFADQAVIAIQNARLIEELGRSREEIGRRAEAEHALREIAADISALRDSDAILQRTVNEALHLLDSDSARIDMVEGDTMSWAFAAGEDAVNPHSTGLDRSFKVGEGVAGRVVTEGEAFRTGDYLHDDRFEHNELADQLVEVTGFNSVLSAPLRGEAGSLGALTVSTRRVGAYDDAQAGLLQALADQAAIAIQNARLIAELNRSRGELARRADAQQSLREIAARITAIREPGPLLQQVVDAAKRLVGGDGSILDLVDERDQGLLRWTYDSGVRAGFTDEEISKLTLPVGVGATGIAVAEDRIIAATGDLRVHFPPSEVNERFFGATNYRSMIVAPITGESGPLGALEVYSVKADAFDDEDAAVIRSLAYQAAIAITNARLIQELERSQAAVESRAERERSLRDITARITSLRDPERDPRPGRRGGATPAPLRRRPPDPDLGGRDLPRSGVRRRRVGRGDRGLAQADGVPARRRNQRARRRGDPAGLDRELRRRSADPARSGGPGGRRAARLAGDGCGTAEGAGGRGHRDARGLVSGGAPDRSGRARSPPGPRRPGGDRADELESLRAPRRVRGALPPPRPELAGSHLVDRRRGAIHVRLRHLRAADRLASPRTSSASILGRSSTNPRGMSRSSTGPPT